MTKVATRAAGLLCVLLCVGGCLTCISDGPVIVVDFVSGGTAATTGSQA